MCERLVALSFVPIHWSDSNASDARVGALVNPAVDPISGEPEFKHTPARVVPFVVAWQGFALSRKPLLVRDATAWSLTPNADCLRYELAGRRVFGNWSPERFDHHAVRRRGYVSSRGERWRGLHGAGRHGTCAVCSV